MDKDLDLNKSGALPDHTAASQRPAADSGTEFSASDLRKGFARVDAIKPLGFGSGMEDITEVPQEDRLMPNSGGFCGRPQGWSR